MRNYVVKIVPIVFNFLFFSRELDIGTFSNIETMSNKLFLASSLTSMFLKIVLRSKFNS